MTLLIIIEQWHKKIITFTLIALYTNDNVNNGHLMSSEGFMCAFSFEHYNTLYRLVKNSYEC